MSSFAERIARLPAKRQELLARLLSRSNSTFRALSSHPQRDLCQIPVVVCARAVVVSGPIRAERAVYNLPDTHHFKGPLNQEALERSLSEIVRRHEVLRTTFQLENGGPVQVVGVAQPLKLELVDLSQLPAVEREAEAQRLADEEAQQPFDLSRGPLFRVRWCGWKRQSTCCC